MTEIILVAKLRHVSPPFNAGTLVELKFATETDAEVYLHVPAEERGRYTLGDTYGVRLTRI